MNLYDLTKGNYRVVRTISYPDFPGSEIVTNAEVKAVKDSEWNTDVSINGNYNGPTDVISVKNYQLEWTSDGKNILETGSSELESKSGGALRQIWKSTITPARGVDKFPRSGEKITVSVSEFKVEGNKMSYKWDGTVRTQSK